MILKVTKRQGFTLSLEDTFLKKRQWMGEEAEGWSLNCFRVKVSILAFMAYSLIQSQLFPQFFMVFHK